MLGSSSSGPNSGNSVIYNYISLMYPESPNKIFCFLSQERKPLDPNDFVVLDDILLIGEVGANHNNHAELLACLCLVF